MPNIELYGYKDEDAIVLEQQMREVLLHAPEPDEIVITHVLSQVRDLKQNSRPFIRIIAGASEIEEMKRRLVPLNEDIEIIKLHEWIEHQ